MSQVLKNWRKIYFPLTILFLSLFIYADYLWQKYDGVWVSGENSVAGQFNPGQSFSHVVKVYNLSSHSIFLGNYPMCGCTETRVFNAEVKPFSQIYVPMTYYVGQLNNKKKIRSVSVMLIYKSNNRVHLVSGQVQYTVVAGAVAQQL